MIILSKIFDPLDGSIAKISDPLNTLGIFSDPLNFHWKISDPLENAPNGYPAEKILQ